MTDRWWVHHKSSLAALGRVDSSDAVQGVGTAVLAYHGLSKAVLAPLAHMTLMDVSAVNKALHGLDIAPVAKALGNATETEMGSASQRYGQLLADDIHATAIESTGRLITSLVQSGMPWPTAIDRASKVHGIPADRLGKAGPALRAPVMQPLAADDIADRALMEYASHVGRREATTTAVSKAEARRQRFRESEVVRDEDGRFSDEGEKKKNSLVELSGDSLERSMERQRRRNKKKRVARVQGELKSSRDARASKQVTLASMAAADRAAAKGRTSDGASASVVRRAGDGDSAAAKTAARQAEARAAAREQARADAKKSVKDAIRAEMMKNLLSELKNRKPATEDTEFGNLRYNPVKPNGEGTYPGLVGGSLGQQQFMVLDVHLAKAIIKQGGFNFGTLSLSDNFYNYNGKSHPLTREELRRQIEELSYEPGSPEDPQRSTLEDLAIVVFDGDVAYGVDHTGSFQYSLADAGSYEAVAGTTALEYEDIYGMELRGFSDPGSSSSPMQEIPLPHFTVKLENDKAFTRLDGIATDYSKAWQESLVMRDEDGRFSDEARVASSPVIGPKSTRAERMARRARKQRANDRYAAAVSARSANKVTLADISANEIARVRRERPSAPADRTSDRVAASSSTSAVDRKAASTDFREKLKADLKAKMVRDVKAKLVAHSAVKMEEKALADEAIRADHHEDWKFLDALTFNRDQVYGSFTDMFGMDPFTGAQQQTGRGVYEESEHQDMLDDAKKRILSATVVVDAMRDKPPPGSLENPVPAWGGDKNEDEPRPVYQHAFDAYAEATAKCDLENKERPYRDRTWMPFAKFDEHSRMYEPWMRQAVRQHDHVVVLGSKHEWNTVMNGGDVELVPLDGFDKDPDIPGQGSFDTLYNAVTDGGGELGYSGHKTIYERSDYFIRAFRIKT